MSKGEVAKVEWENGNVDKEVGNFFREEMNEIWNRKKKDSKIYEEKEKK